MAQVAYDLEHFAPQPRRARPQVRVAKRSRSARQAQMFKMARTLVGVLLLVILVCGVLYTQASIAELQTEITAREKELAEEKSLNTYLNFEMENRTSLKEIEERAQALGLEKMDSGQMVYFRAEEDTNGIQVKQNPIAQFFANARDGLLSIWEYLTP